MFNQFITTKTTLLDKTQGIYPHFSAIASQQFLRLHPSHQPRFFAARAFPTQVNLDRIAKEWLAKQQFSSTLRSKPFANTLIVGMQHILGTTVDMFSAMRNMGLKHAVIGGKSYSTHNKSARKISGIGFKYIKNTEQLRYGQFNEINTAINCKIWDEALKQIYNRQFNQLIILDDGANLLLNVPAELFNGIKNKPSSIIGIEQTRNGLNNVCFQGLPFPVVNVAGSWVKNIVEYPWVVRAIIGKLNHIFNTQIASNYSRLSTKYVFGVVGYGAMGQTITKELISRNFKVIVFDDDIVRRSSIPRENRYPNMQALISNSDIIIGCTGTDITSSPQSLASIVYSRDKKWLISASSKDTEFNSLLIEIQNRTKKAGYTPNPLENINYKNNVGANIVVIRGGFPINFDNSEHSVEPQHIWPTRAALMFSTLMCVGLRCYNGSLLEKSANVLMLDPLAQLMIFRKYNEMNPEDQSIKAYTEISDDELLKLIKKKSEGEEMSLRNIRVPQFNQEIVRKKITTPQSNELDLQTSGNICTPALFPV